MKVHAEMIRRHVNVCANSFEVHIVQLLEILCVIDLLSLLMPVLCADTPQHRVTAAADTLLA